MKFSGRLQIEADPRNWLKTDLNLNHGRVELVSGDDILGSWSTAHVKAERVEGDRFELQLGEDRAVFAADDALAFSYEALPVLAKKTVLTAATGLRGKLRKGLAGADRPAPNEPTSVGVSTAGTLASVFTADHPVTSDVAHQVVEIVDTPQPTRKLRDLIQAAVRNTPVEQARTPDTWWGGEDDLDSSHSPLDDIDDLETIVEQLDEVEAPESVWPSEDTTELLPELTDLAGGPGTELFPDQSATDPEDIELPLTELPVTELPVTTERPITERPISEPMTKEFETKELGEQPAYDLSPLFAEPGGYDKRERVRPSKGLLDPEGSDFEEGETLGERPAEPFGWIRAAEEAMPPAFESPVVQPLATAILGEAPTPVVRSLDALIDEVRSGAFSPAQVGAVTDLIRAVADAIEGKNLS